MSRIDLGLLEQALLGASVILLTALVLAISECQGSLSDKRVAEQMMDFYKAKCVLEIGK